MHGDSEHKSRAGKRARPGAELQWGVKLEAEKLRIGQRKGER